jgi:hypothetical protein
VATDLKSALGILPWLYPPHAHQPLEPIWQVSKICSVTMTSKAQKTLKI